MSREPIPNTRTTVSGLGWQLQCVVCLTAVSVVFFRRPDLFTNPQFYFEDGSVWYADAYNLGWLHALTIPAGGYLNTLQRLGGALAQVVPLRQAPLLMNCLGIFIQVLPVFFLLSIRCANWWPLRVRLLQAGIYLAIPNAREIHVVLTNAPFHLALLAFLIAVAAPPISWSWKIFDGAVLAISALSGPFCIVLLPLVLVFWRLRRKRWTLVLAAIPTPLIALQAAELLSGGLADRSPRQLGATAMLFLRILAGHVFVGGLWGENGFAMRAQPTAILLVFLLGTVILLYVLLRGTLELRLFIVFSMLLFGAALSKPLIAGPLPAWQLLALDRGARYWFFPMLAFLWSLLWCVTQRQNKPFRILGFLSLAVLPRGMIHDRQYPPFPDQHSAEFVKRFDAAPAGAILEVPCGPAEHAGALTKH